MTPFYSVTVKDIMTFRGCSYNTARKEWRQIADALDVPSLQYRHLVTYWGCSLEELRVALLPTSRK